MGLDSNQGPLPYQRQKQGFWTFLVVQQSPYLSLISSESVPVCSPLFRAGWCTGWCTRACSARLEPAAFWFVVLTSKFQLVLARQQITPIKAEKAALLCLTFCFLRLCSILAAALLLPQSAWIVHGMKSRTSHPTATFAEQVLFSDFTSGAYGYAERRRETIPL